MAIPPQPQAGHAHYDANYGNFQTALYEEIRRDAFGEDIGQNSWLTAGELDACVARLDLGAGKRLLDVACGAGGPALRVAAMTGCSIVGIDAHEHAIVTARSLADQRGMAAQAEFHCWDAQRPLPFADASFDAITCIDAINHLANRPSIVAEWARLLKPGARMLFTNATVVTGPLTNAEIAVRSSIGFFLFVPPGYDEHVIAENGFRLIVRQDVTASVALIAGRRRAARAARSGAVRDIEGEQAFAAQQDFLETAARIAAEGRLSRFLYVAERVA